MVKEKMETSKDEPKETKKAPKEKAQKAPKEKKARVTRVSHICAAISSVPKKGLTVKELAEKADASLGKAGGKANLKQTIHHTQVLVPAAIAWGIVKMEDGRVVPAQG